MNEYQMLDQLENLLVYCEKADKNRMPTMKAFLILTRVVYYLLKQRINTTRKGV